MSFLDEKSKGFIKKEEILLIKPEDQHFLNSFLMEVKKRSDGSYRNNKMSLKKFFKIINKPIKDITLIDVRNYFVDYLDKEKLALTSKETHRSNLHSFFSHIQEILLSQNVLYQNPVPSKKIFKFTQKEKDVKKQSEKALKILNPESILTILEYCHKNRRLKDFILIGLIICTGARLSEIITLKIKDINLKERYFETGFMKNARKSTLRTKEGLLFFFPEKFKPFLKNYILSLQSLDPDIKFIFAGRDKKKPMKVQYAHYVRKILKTKLNIIFSYHYFRRSLITERAKMNCPSWVSEGLMNHKGSTVESRHYIKLNIKEKRDLYDKYFPYYSFPYF